MSSDPAHVLACRGLRKAYDGLVAVDDVGFSIAPGETYGLLGPNGAGKTTTISMVCGLLEPDAGEVTIAGLPMSTRAPQAKAAIGLVPQDLAIYADLTARENLRFFARLYDMSAAEARTRADAVLEVVGLADRAADPSRELSGGMKRRLNIGIGLLHRPRLLVLDEPTVGVDPQSRNAILSSVEELSGEGMAVLYTTHYMEEAERLCDRIGIIDSGRVQAEGTRRELVSLVGQHDRVLVTGEGDLAAAARAVAGRPDVHSADAAEGRVELLVDAASRVLVELLGALTAAGMTISSVEVEEPDLEAVFLHLTGRALRE